MKLSRFFNTSKSFSKRLTFWVLLTTGIIFALICIVLYFFMRNGLSKEAKQRAEGVLENTTLRINHVLNSVEVAVGNTVPLIYEHLDDPDKMYEITKQLLDINPIIAGSAVAFEPNYYKDRGVQFSPYAYRDGLEISSKQLGTDDYEYHYMDWYQIPKLLDTDYWSEPYYDAGGGEMIMTTYSYPLRDKDGKIFAIFTADVSLDWLTKLLNNIKYYKDAYTLAVSRGGTYIVHPRKERILNETIFSNITETEDTLDDGIAHAMIDGKEGFSKFKNDGIPSVAFYKPIQRTGWSMAIICPEKEFFQVVSLLGFIVVATMFLGLLTLLFVCHKGVKHITRPLERFAHSANEIAAGNFESELPEITTKDEMLKLHDSFKMMQNSLTERIEELKVVNEQKGRIESELRIASGIQQSMIPKIFPPYPDRSDVDIYGQLVPAKEVGGDLYDFYIRDEKLFFCIGDVSGKGVPASLVMAVTRSLFRIVSAHESNAGKIVTQMNEAMADMNESMMFVTLFVGVLDLPSGRLRFCNAGHCAPLMVGSGMGLLPVIPNMPLGIVMGFKFEVQETLLDPGSIIFLYTDGLTEAENISHEQYEEHRMLALTKQLKEEKKLNPTSFIKRMTDSVNEFVDSAPQSDDLTMLAVQYKGLKRDIRMQRSIVLANDVNDVPRLNEFVDQVAEALELDASLGMSLNLALEEAVVNVMNYAYPDGKAGTVNIEASADDDFLNFVISDSGIPFDPTTKEEADTTLSVEDRPIGGLGIFLVRQLMDTINYERVDGKNVLRLGKKLNQQSKETQE